MAIIQSIMMSYVYMYIAVCRIRVYGGTTGWVVGQDLLDVDLEVGPSYAVSGNKKGSCELIRSLVFLQEPIRGTPNGIVTLSTYSSYNRD